MPCSKVAPNARYLSKIPYRAQSQEVYVLRSFWEPIGACGLQTRTDGSPPRKIVVILNLEALRSVKQLRATLGHTGYYIKFIQGYAQITALMEKLLKKDATFCWNNHCKKILDILKEKTVTTLILIFPDYKKEFHVHVDMSCITLGAVLTQNGGEGLDHPIAFASRRLSKSEKNYFTTKCEGLAMVYALHKYWHYLLGGHFKMYTDQSMLKYMVNKLVLGGESEDGSYCSKSMILKLL